MGRVKDRSVRSILFIAVKELLVDTVSIQGNHRTELHGIDLASAALQRAGNKAAVILHRITLGLVEFSILFRRLGSPYRIFQPLLQIIEGDGLVHPGLCLTVIAVCDCKLPHQNSLLSQGVSPNSNRA